MPLGDCMRCGYVCRRVVGLQGMQSDVRSGSPTWPSYLEIIVLVASRMLLPLTGATRCWYTNQLWIIEGETTRRGCEFSELRNTSDLAEPF